MPVAEETFVDPTVVVDPVGHVEVVNPSVVPLLSLRALRQSIMTT